VKKRTRAPSAYNLYIKEKMAEFKAAGHKGNLMKMAIDAWNEDKSSGKIEVKSTTKNTNTTDIESDDGTSDDDTKTKKTKATKAKETKTKETKTKEKKTKKTIDPTSEPTIDTTSDTDYE
jgi:Ran GTPase-activating protein (RanGAP) involved in mRNA processing and transport